MFDSINPCRGLDIYKLPLHIPAPSLREKSGVDNTGVCARAWGEAVFFFYSNLIIPGAADASAIASSVTSFGP